MTELQIRQLLVLIGSARSVRPNLCRWRSRLLNLRRGNGQRFGLRSIFVEVAAFGKWCRGTIVLRAPRYRELCRCEGILGGLQILKSLAG